jgi:hypothetical protein
MHSTAAPSLCPQVCELVWVCVDPATCTPNPSMLELTRSIVQAVMGLRPRFGVAAQKQAAGGRHACERRMVRVRDAWCDSAA